MSQRRERTIVPPSAAAPLMETNDPVTFSSNAVVLRDTAGASLVLAITDLPPDEQPPVLQVGQVVRLTLKYQPQEAQ